MIIMSFNDGVASRTIQLQDPNLPLKQSIETKVAFRTSMSGVTYGRRTSLRPVVLTYQFSALPRIKARELEDFVALGAGQNVRLIDSDGQNWNVKFSTPSIQFTTTGRGIGVAIPEFVDVVITLAGSKFP